MAVLQFAQPDDQPVLINTVSIVTATSLPDGLMDSATGDDAVRHDTCQLIVARAALRWGDDFDFGAMMDVFTAGLF